MNKSTLVPREEMSDLDWLARNIHQWPAGEHQPWCYVYWKGGHRAVSANCITVIQPCVRVEMSDWLARRAELQNKPSWWLSESWSKYLAQDMDGEWKWLGENPSLGDDHWTADELRSQCKGVVIGDWWDTLEKRPEQKAFKPLTSIEDNQEQDMTKQQEMKQDNGWYERGDLPPVGIAVQLWHGGTYAYDCELIAKRGNDFVLWNLTWDRPDSADCMMCVFKPTPTEREMLADLIESHGQMSALVVADAILATGFSLGAK